MGFPPGEAALDAVSSAPVANEPAGTREAAVVDEPAGADAAAVVAESAGAGEPAVTDEPARLGEPAVADEPARADQPARVDEPVGAGGPAGMRWAAGPRQRASTGDARVDDAVARLDDLAGLPVAEHLAVFEYVHERLTEALGDLDVHAPARPGDAAPGPGG